MTTDEIKKSLSCVCGEIQLKGSQEALGKYFGALKECVEILDKYEALKNKEKHEEHFYGLLIKWFERTIADFKKENDKSAIIDEFVSRVKLKYLGVHPDELCMTYYPEEIVETVEEIAEKLKGEDNGSRE